MRWTGGLVVSLWLGVGCSASAPGASVATRTPAPAVAASAPGDLCKAAPMTLARAARALDEGRLGRVPRLLDTIDARCPERAASLPLRALALAELTDAAGARKVIGQVPAGSDDARVRAAQQRLAAILAPTGQSKQADALVAQADAMTGCAQAEPMFLRAWETFHPNPSALLGAARCARARGDLPEARRREHRAAFELERVSSTPLQLEPRLLDPELTPLAPLVRLGDHIFAETVSGIVVADARTWLPERILDFGGEKATLLDTGDEPAHVLATTIANGTQSVWELSSHTPRLVASTQQPSSENWVATDRGRMIHVTDQTPMVRDEDGETIEVPAVLFWPVDRPGPIATLTHFSKDAQSFVAPMGESMSASGRWLAIDWSDGAREVVDAHTGKVVLQAGSAVNLGYQHSIPGGDFSPDDTRTFGADARGLLLIEVPSGRRIASLSRPGCDQPLAVVFGGAGRLVATGGTSEGICLWDARTGAFRSRITPPPNSAPTEVSGGWAGHPKAFIGDDRGLLATRNSSIGGTGGPLVLWDVARRTQVGEFGDGGQWQLLAPVDDRAIATDSQLVTIGADLKPRTLAQGSFSLSPDRSLAYDSVSHRIFSVRERAWRATIGSTGPEFLPRLRFDLARSTMASNASVWNINTGASLLDLHTRTDRPDHVAADPAHDVFAVLTLEGTLVRWEPARRSLRVVATRAAELGSVRGLAVSGEVVSALVERGLGYIVRRFESPLQEVPVCEASRTSKAVLSPDGERIARVDVFSGDFAICSARTGQQLHQGRVESVRDVAFLSSQEVALWGEKKLVMVDVASGRQHHETTGVNIQSVPGAMRLEPTPKANPQLWGTSGQIDLGWLPPASWAALIRSLTGADRLLAISDRSVESLWDLATHRLMWSHAPAGSLAAHGSASLAFVDRRSVVAVDAATGRTRGTLLVGRRGAMVLADEGVYTVGPREAGLAWCLVGQEFVPDGVCRDRFFLDAEDDASGS